MLSRFLRRLASFSRLILFDKRGTGLSDRVPVDSLPTLEERLEDALAVLDAVGSDRTAAFGHSEGGNLSVLLAASQPKRCTALVTAGIFAKRTWSPDYPWAPQRADRERYIEAVEANWGEDADVENLAPSAAKDEAFGRALATYFRRSASPGAAAALLRMNTEIDIRDLLPTIRVPTLIIHRTNDRDTQVDEGRWIAERVPGARFVELPGEDHLPWVGDQDSLLDEVERFVTGALGPHEHDRVLVTLLFTDIVGSTERAAEVGDVRWRAVLEEHRAVVRRQLRALGGQEVDTTGDGFLATFSGPGRALHAATAIHHEVARTGLRIRAGVHTGECEMIDGGVGGIAVHIAARIAALAGPGETLVSSTVTNLVAGSGIAFESRGTRPLKGVPGEWEVFSVGGGQPQHR